MTRAHQRSLWAIRPSAACAAEALAALGLDGSRATHRYVPQGSSALCVGLGVTVALHTWPEHGLATLDVYGTLPVDPTPLLASVGWTPLPEVTPC